VDNLNIDFLYPILSQDSFLLAELMKSLSAHLQPAPYPFGLLTLRLLGKLGGKNRYFLQDPMDLEHSLFSHAFPDAGRFALFSCRLGEVKYPLPIDLAVSILKSIPAKQRICREAKKAHFGINDGDSFKKFFHQVRLESFDFDTYNSDVNGEVIKSLVVSAFDILRSGISSIVTIHSNAIEAISDLSATDNTMEISLHSSIENETRHLDKELLLLLDGLIHATLFDYLISSATYILDGFLAYAIFLCVKYHKYFSGTESSGEMIPSNDITDLPSAIEFRPFGCIQVDGPLSQGFNILIMNDLFASVLSQGKEEACQSVLRMIGEIKPLYSRMAMRLMNVTSNGASDDEHQNSVGNVRIIYENLLLKLCLETFSVSNMERFWLHEGIFRVLLVMGKDWSLRFEGQLLQVAFYSINHSIYEITRTARDSLIFFFRVCYFLHGTPIEIQGKPDRIIHDDFDLPEDWPVDDNPLSSFDNDVILDQNSSASILIQHLSSVNNTVRYEKLNQVKYSSPANDEFSS